MFSQKFNCCQELAKIGRKMNSDDIRIRCLIFLICGAFQGSTIFFLHKTGQYSSLVFAYGPDFQLASSWSLFCTCSWYTPRVHRYTPISLIQPTFVHPDEPLAIQTVVYMSKMGWGAILFGGNQCCAKIGMQKWWSGMINFPNSAQYAIDWLHLNIFLRLRTHVGVAHSVNWPTF